MKPVADKRRKPAAGGKTGKPSVRQPYGQKSGRAFRRKMEAELAESERTTRALMDASPNVMFLIDTRGIILAANETFRRIFSGDGRSLEGRNISEVVYPEEARINLEKASEAVRTGKAVFFEHQFRGQWVEKSFYPILDDQGRVNKLACYGRVVTGEKRAEEALRESERRYRLLADHATDSIWTMDWNLKLTYASPGITRLRGYTPEEVMAESLGDSLTPASWALVQKVYAEELAEEQKTGKDLHRTRTLELEYRCKDGSTVWAESRISALRDARGKILEIIGVTRDITERRKAEEALRQSEKAARRLAREHAAMAEITRIISSSLNIEEVYERFAEEMHGLIDFESLIVAMTDLPGNLVKITYAAGVPLPGRPTGSVFPLEGTAAKEVYDTRSSLFLQKEELARAVEKLPRLKPAFEAGMRSMIIVPLISEGKVIGIINFLSSRPEAHTPEDLKIAEKVARQISGAIAKAQLFQELHRTAKALKESEAQNRSLVEAAGISGLGIVVFAGEAKGEVVCLFANEQTGRITGYSQEELFRTPFLEIIHPAHREAASSGYWTRMGGAGEPALYQIFIRHKKGHTVLIEISTTHTIFHGQECMIGFFRDISARRRTESALEENEAKFRALVRNAGDMIFLHLLDDQGRPGRFIEVNDLACQKLGYTREELLARTPREITLEYEEVSPSILEQVMKAAREADGQSRVTFEAILLDKAEGQVPAEISFEVFTLRGRRVGIAIARDITERRRTEKELADYRAHLEQMVQERTARVHQLEQQRGEIEKMAATGVLAARIAHEINDPLAGIKGAFMLIQEAIPPDHRYHRYVGSIHQEINRIARIVRQMFELYRPPEEAREELPIEQMIQDVASLLNPECRDRKVSFQLELLPAKVRLPAGPVRQVLFNILKNAVEASPEQGVVRVSTGQREGGIAIQVQDQGPGIPDKNRPHIFKPFFTTKTEPQRGLGLGLSISRDIVKSLGGSIRFTSRRGKGTVFQIDLPGNPREKGEPS